MGVVLFLLVMAMLVVFAVVAGFSVGAALTTRSRPPLPPPPHQPLTNWPGYQGPGGPLYPAYNPAQYLSPDDRERIMVLIRSGQKIQAIKLYRGATGSGLAEARAAVEHLERLR